MRRRLTTDEFIKRAKKIHGDKYDYSMTEYIDAHTKVCIICPIHGEFWQTPTCHTDGKTGCPKCSITYKTKETIACMNTNRNYIGFENNKEYYDISEIRIKEHIENNVRH